MGQIIVTRRDGSEYPLAVKKDATTITSARQNWSLLSEDVVNITVESPYPQDYRIGDTIRAFARDYRLNRLPRVRKTGVYKYTYDLTFEGVQYDLLRVFYDLTIETTSNVLQDVQGDALTGDLRRFATVLVSNANRVYPNRWRLGSCPGTVSDKTLSFSEGDNCLAVLQNLCKEFEVEMEIVQASGVYVINFHEKVGTTLPIEFSFGKGNGLYALDRQNVDSSNIITRLKAYGSTDNITHKYRAHRLCLPGKSKAQSFIEKTEAVRKYGIHEACKIFEDIKPTFNGRITGTFVGEVLKFSDASMFDLNEKEPDGETKYLIAGVSAKIHFNTGNLAGYEFDVHEYDHPSRTFTLKQFQDGSGHKFPSDNAVAFQFDVGDEYKILDVTLPGRYQQEAEEKLKEEAEKHYNENSQPKVKYGLSVSKSYLEKLFGTDASANVFSPGDSLHVIDAGIGVDKSVRIQAVDRNLLDVYDYTLTISDTVETSILSSMVSELSSVNNAITMNGLSDPAKAKSNWRSSREIMGMVFDPDGDYYTDKIKPNSVDTLALSVGAKSMQFILSGTTFEANFNGNKNAVRIIGGSLVHYAIEEVIRTWKMSNTTQTMNDDKQAYYIYAKCLRRGNSGVFLFSTETIKADQDPKYYHFWVGVLNSVDPELQVRSIALMYGFSMINGRFITTGRIQSGDKSTYFDLDDAEIAGRINFKDGLVSGDIGVGNSLGINAGICGDGISLSSIRFYAGATKQNKHLAPFRVQQDGTAIAQRIKISGESTFSGMVTGITGSFKRLICVNENSQEVGSIAFGSDGKMWFSGDLFSQGYDYTLGRGYRLYASSIWCRGNFGARSLNTLVVNGSSGYYYVNGLGANNGRIPVTFNQATSGGGVVYYDIPLYGAMGDAAGFAVDLIVINARQRHNYNLVGDQGKSVLVANANDQLSHYIFAHGALQELRGGLVSALVNVGYANMVPAQGSTVLGAGWLFASQYDNSWG